MQGFSPRQQPNNPIHSLRNPRNHKEENLQTIIKKQNAFISDSSIIPIYDIKERDVNTFKILINNSMYIQEIEETYESTSKGKYFLITTKTGYRKSLTEANDMIKYIYLEIINTNYNR